MNVHQLDSTGSVEALVQAGVELAVLSCIDPTLDPRRLAELVDSVAALEQRRSPERMTGMCAPFAHTLLVDSFERGWQPSELMHVLTRRLDKTCIPMVGALIGGHARKTCALSTAPLDWRDQLVDLGIDVGRDLVDHRMSARQSARSFWLLFFRVLAQLRLLPPMAMIAPPPSRWSQDSAAATPGRVNPKVLKTIRGLLAKAESSTFDAEAETFSAKAQEMMTRYAIDTAVLESGESEPLNKRVVTRRILIDNPYTDAKMQLMTSVAASNGTKTVWLAKLGLISVTGMPADLDLCELLYTSLLVQSARALDNAGTDSRTRSRGFRRAFLLGYAWRIGERLAEARVRANEAAGESYGGALVPILAEREEAVSCAFRELYPSLRRSRTSVSDRHGLQRGRAAADVADLTGGRERVDGPRRQ